MIGEDGFFYTVNCHVTAIGSVCTSNLWRVHCEWTEVDIAP